ncbi:SRPBCC domain-containing protein [Microbacterium gorillae]|uniref:SRPBCC domain-containing protein n=1 Tax=Microbacterium gorillae TaxID=1231063 RepID=UPI00058EA60E|nr:SRPBCC domain-containing protein [Microbacterium gorillae]
MNAETTHERVGEQSVRHRREFDAPAAAVQRAHTDPELFARWMGPRGTTVRFERFDAATGGAFRYAVVAGSAEFPFFGSYHRVSEGRIIHTWEYDGETEFTLEDLVFSDLPDGRSVLEVTSTYVSKAACDAMLASDLDEGMTENFSRLDELLAA